MPTLSYMEGSPKIAYERQGSGPLVVFMHGIGGNRGNWTGQLEHFGRRYCAVAWDARGYGASDDSPATLKFTDYADDLRRLLDHLKAAKAHVVGLSMGGMIAQDFYGRYSDRVATLSLVDTNSGVGMTSDAFKQDFLARRLEPLERGLTPADTAIENAKALVSPHTPDELVAKLRSSLSALRVEPYKQAVRAIMTTNFLKVHPAIKVPTLVIVGADDRLTTPAQADELAKNISGAQKVVIDRAGHLSNLERPDDFNRALEAFLDRHAALASRMG
ncbi:MAG: alpha/beta fold hydrolase [Candidatus Binataceae bacterium]|nr:alpha/beta fold hydrolase [Candidatus Binataceae bacterium]